MDSSENILQRDPHFDWLFHSRGSLIRHMLVTRSAAHDVSTSTLIDLHASPGGHNDEFYSGGRVRKPGRWRRRFTSYALLVLFVTRAIKNGELEDWIGCA